MQLIQHLLKMQQVEDEVCQIKNKSIEKINNTTDILKEAGRLQSKVLQRTTTYYIGKAVGGHYE